ncbi:DUF423 domain-containing protein [Olivibacter sp. SDN3]|uniref:DUF423 domain-containing protein n=1 Tax=Olivibacter sp. SDN3 TaxID=2764720 RepID=UPI001650E3F9|nr:DUF423 domain-containing protein [Olivibacter sp. SDN3]QNL49397.1 DUF423 domain-containing protein [Olivibacter sp. SDN3]
MIAQIFGAAFGLLAVILGAFGAHALKKKFTVEQQQSFETGVRYQMYHAIVLLLFGHIVDASTELVQVTTILFILGTILFSFSIYGLCLSSAFGKKLRFLGPVTPLGGLLLVGAWFLLLYQVVIS